MPVLRVCLPRVHDRLSGNCVVCDCVTPVLSRPIAVKPVPELKLNVGKACEVGCWLMFIPVRSSCESASAPVIGKPTLVVALVNPKRNSFTNRGVITQVCETRRLRL